MTRRTTHQIAEADKVLVSSMPTVSLDQVAAWSTRCLKAEAVLGRHRRSPRPGIEAWRQARAVAGDAAVFEAGAGVGGGFVHPGVAAFAGVVDGGVGGVAGGEAFDAGR